MSHTDPRVLDEIVKASNISTDSRFYTGGTLNLNNRATTTDEDTTLGINEFLTFILVAKKIQ